MKKRSDPKLDASDDKTPAATATTSTAVSTKSSTVSTDKVRVILRDPFYFDKYSPFSLWSNDPIEEQKCRKSYFRAVVSHFNQKDLSHVDLPMYEQSTLTGIIDDHFVVILALPSRKIHKVNNVYRIQAGQELSVEDIEEIIPSLAYLQSNNVGSSVVKNVRLLRPNFSFLEAAKDGDVSELKSLLEDKQSTADINEKNENGKTAFLIIATAVSSNPYVEHVKLLDKFLENSALDLNVIDQSKMSALDYLADYYRVSIRAENENILHLILKMSARGAEWVEGRAAHSLILSASRKSYDYQYNNQLRTAYLLDACRTMQGELDLTKREDNICFSTNDDEKQYTFPDNKEYVAALNENPQLNTLTLSGDFLKLGNTFIKLLPLMGHAKWLTTLKMRCLNPDARDLAALANLQLKINADSKFTCIDIEPHRHGSMSLLEIFSNCKSLTSLVVNIPKHGWMSPETYTKLIEFLNKMPSIHSLNIVIVDKLSPVQLDKIIRLITTLKFIETLHVKPCDSGSHNYLQWIQNALQSNDRLTSLKLVDPIAPECSIPDSKSNTVKKIIALLELNKLYRPRSITDWQSIAF